MATRMRLDLATFDVRLLYGLTFCRKVYALFDQIKDSAGGMERLRLLKTKLEKRVVEGLIPISKFVHAHYNEAHRVSLYS